MKNVTEQMENYEMLHNWQDPENHIKIQKIINMDENHKFLFRQKARTSLIKATDMLPLAKLMGKKTRGKVKLTANKHRVWQLPNNRTNLLTLQVLAGVLPNGELIPFFQDFCGLDYTNSDFATREIAKDNLLILERKNTHMHGTGLKSIFWAGEPNTDLRKSSDDLLAVARAVCMITYSKIFTRGLLTEEADNLIDKTITLTNFSIKELKQVIMPSMSMDKISHCLGVFLLAGWLKRIPEKFTIAGAQALKDKEEGTNTNDYTVTPSIYQMVGIDTVDWAALLDVINLDTTAAVRSDLVTYWLGADAAKQFVNHNGRTITTPELEIVTKIKNQLEENTNNVVPKKQMAMMLQRANMHMKGDTALQHMKDLLIWKQFNLIEISSKLAYMMGFNSQKRTLKDKVIVNATEYWARKSY